jgi:hypothetical protein
MHKKSTTRVVTYFSAAISMKKKAREGELNNATHKCGAHNFPDKICLFIQSHTGNVHVNVNLRAVLKLVEAVPHKTIHFCFNPTGKFRKSFGQAPNQHYDLAKIPTGFHFPL